MGIPSEWVYSEKDAAYTQPGLQPGVLMLVRLANGFMLYLRIRYRGPIHLEISGEDYLADPMPPLILLDYLQDRYPQIAEYLAKCAG